MKGKGRVEGTVRGCFVRGRPTGPEFYWFSVLVFWWGHFRFFGDFWEPVGLRALKLGTHTHDSLIGMHTPTERAGHLTKKRLTYFSDDEAHRIIGHSRQTKTDVQLYSTLYVSLTMSSVMIPAFMKAPTTLQTAP